MAPSDSSSPSIIALDELIALTDEMAALARAGVPLSTGLASAARDLTRRPGKIAAAVSERLDRGESLPHVIDSMPQVFPPAYRAVVAAGLKAGRLPAALEGLATSSRRLADLRRLTRAALVYPLFVAFAAYGLLAYGLTAFQPTIRQTYASMGEQPSQLNLTLVKIGEIASDWLPWIPVVVLLLILAWWYRSTRATAVEPRFSWFGAAGRMLYYGRVSAFTETLALLVENCVPTPLALELAADVNGDNSIQLAARGLAADLERGGNSSVPTTSAAGLPPLVQWLIVGGGSQTVLSASLRNTAEAYRRRALRLEDWLRLYLPMALTIGIGGTAVVIYALCMLVPWYQMLTHFGVPAK